jgi:hypothetical protein
LCREESEGTSSDEEQREDSGLEGEALAGSLQEWKDKLLDTQCTLTTKAQSLAAKEKELEDLAKRTCVDDKYLLPVTSMQKVFFDAT